ncbi:MAG: UDP-N-acetylmuramoyl-L-alanyl-D-glutamate--2,6-diaminopimelate ligase [Alphaproteobacteria bacterium]|nr:MAG: UDP-N-acetylmuramoyl-L-alanyl-D-glutamate--2,6-diaminopimelate ligase [Alphaproteobacteria bacterium]
MSEISILDLEYFSSAKLQTCSGSQEIQITTVCKHTDHLSKAVFFLDERNLISTANHPQLEGKIVISENSTILKTTNPKKTWAEMASIAFPQQPNFIALITGTDGKTSTAWITFQTWKSLNIKAGYIGTLGIYLHDQKFENKLTTPDAATLHYFLNQMKIANIEHVVIEASSIGLDQERLSFVKADIAIFTSFASDHLDYHNTKEKYLESKLKIINNLKDKKDLIVHSDVAKHIPFNCLTYGINSEFNSEYINQKWKFSIKNQIFYVKNKLIGDFNGDNMLGAYFVLKKSGLTNTDIFESFNKLETVPGRINLVFDGEYSIFVDFAHTEHALLTVLTALKQQYENISLVFGCGGNRDKGKRQKMGAIAQQMCNSVIICNDNPRNEDPLQIALEIASNCSKAQIILDRKEAIKYAIKNLSKGDVLLVSGKGDERTQIIGDKVEEFHDATEINKIITYEINQ